MALYRFLFAPVLLAIAVATGPAPSDRSAAPEPSAPPASSSTAPDTATAAPPPPVAASLHRASGSRPIRAR